MAREKKTQRVKIPHLKNGLINFAMENMIYSLIEAEQSDVMKKGVALRSNSFIFT